MNCPSVAVITVTLNAEDCIEYNLLNVAAQSYPCSHIIVDGGSTDGTLRLVRDMQKVYKHIELTVQKDNGIYDAMNKAITLVRERFDIIALLNADDLYTGVDSLGEMVRALGRDSDVLFSNVGYVTDAGLALKRLTTYSSDDRLDKSFFLSGGQFAHPGMIAKSVVYERLMYDSGLDIAADYRFQVELSQSLFKIKVLPGHFVNQRMGGFSQSGFRSFLRGKLQIYLGARLIFGRLNSFRVVLMNLVRKFRARK